jgi:hypothetical protein
MGAILSCVFFCSRNSRYPQSCLMGAILNCNVLLFQEQPLPEPAAPGSAASHRRVQSGSARLQVPVPGLLLAAINKLLFSVADPDPGSFCPWIQDTGSGMEKLDPGWKNSDPGSKIKIPDPQHCFYLLIYTSIPDKI